MKIIICGAGQVGFNIAQHLAGQQHDVVVIDHSPDLVRRISEKLDLQAILGHGSNPDILSNAGAADADLLVAVTNSDEVNMIACQVAHSLFNVPIKIARIRNQAYQKDRWADLFSREHMPIDVIISPEREVAKALKRRLSVPGAFNVVPFVDGKVHLLGLTLDRDCPVIDTPLRQLTELFPNLHAVVALVNRAGRLFVPSSEDQLQAGDNIYLAVSAEKTARNMAVFGFEEPEARRVVIVGGGNIGLYFAEYLEKSPVTMNVKLIEIDPERATYLAERLGKTVVIKGDALNRDILTEAAISSADTVVSIADDDEVNILASLLAKQNGCPYSIALVNNPVYKGLIDRLGIDVAIDPKETTVSSIVRHIRRGRIRDLYTVFDGGAEIIESQVLAGSGAAGRQIGSLHLKGEAKVCMIVREDEVIVPHADTQLEAGDSVVIMVLSDAVRRIEKLFSAKADIF